MDVSFHRRVPCPLRQGRSQLQQHAHSGTGSCLEAHELLSVYVRRKSEVWEGGSTSNHSLHRLVHEWGIPQMIPWKKKEPRVCPAAIAYRRAVWECKSLVQRID